jgi:hypothetical protein
MTSMPTSPDQRGLLPHRAQLQALIGSMLVTQLLDVATALGIADQLTEARNLLTSWPQPQRWIPMLCTGCRGRWPVTASLRRPGTAPSP